MKTLAILSFMFIVFSLHTLKAQNAPVTSIGNYSMSASTITVPVSVTGFINIGSCNLKITYNPSIVVATNLSIANGVGGNISINLTVSGEISLGWYTYPGKTLANNSVLFNIVFQKINAGNTALTFSDNGYSCIYYDGNWNVLNDSPDTTYYHNGSINVLPSYAPHTIAPVMTVIPGNSVSIPIKVSNFNTIGSLALNLSYNPSVLSYITYINNSSFTTFTVFSPVAGSLLISASSTLSSGITYPDSTLLFTLIFNSLGGNTYLNWMDNGISCSYTGPLGYPTLIDSLQSNYYINGSVINAVTSIKGKFTYNNAANTPINGATIQLVNSSNSIIATTTTSVYSDYSIPANPLNVGGYYEFINMNVGNYYIRAIPSIPWGGVNSTDALIVKKHTVGLTTLTGLPIKAADVNQSNIVNSTDALLLQLRSIGTITQFALGNWVYSDSAVSVTANATHNIQLLAAGDVNQSYSFSSKKEKEIINFLQLGKVFAEKNKEIDVEVSVNDILSLGAVSMDMLFDQNKIEIHELTSILKEIKYCINNGIIRIAWADLNTQLLHPDDVLFTLNAKVKTEAINITDVFSYSDNTEFADENGNHLEFSTLKISYSTIVSNYDRINIYPNPCRNYINIEFVLNEAGKISFMLYNTLGQRIDILSEAYCKTGINKFSFDTSDLNPGIYSCEMIINGVPKTIKKIIK